MKFLILGGTGTIGSELSKILSSNIENEVFIISRHKTGTYANSHYISGDVFDKKFASTLLTIKYDAIIDFLWHSKASISRLLPDLLNSTSHYFFLSSAAVYADSKTPLTETSPRFIDCKTNATCFSPSEYHVAKALAEDVVATSRNKNWTILRPHVTFNSNRIPLCTWEMSTWLACALNNIPIAIPFDVLPHYTTLTPGWHVAHQIRNLIGKREAMGEIFNLGSETVHTWEELLSEIILVLESLECKLTTKKSSASEISRLVPSMKNRFSCDRLLDRRFDLSKYKLATGDDNHDEEPLNSSLKKCLIRALENDMSHARFCDIPALQANSKITGTPTPISLFRGRDKAAYLLSKYGASDRLTTCLAYPDKAIKIMMQRFFQPMK